MSFEKIAGTPNVLSFYYTIDELFNLDSLWSMYKLDHLEDGEANDDSLIDKLSITDDEKEDIFLSMLSDIVFDVFNRFLKYTTGITDAIQFNVDYTPDGGSLAKSTFLQIVDHATYNENYPSIVDKLFGKCLKYYLLKQWFAYKDMNEAAVKMDAAYQLNLRKLFRHSSQLKKVAITI